MSQFNIVFRNQNTAELVVLCSVHDPNEATIALHDQRGRLLQDQVPGELQLVHHGDWTHTLLREVLDSAPLPS